MAHAHSKSGIDACMISAQECEHCGDACIGQGDVAGCRMLAPLARSQEDDGNVPPEVCPEVLPKVEYFLAD